MRSSTSFSITFGKFTWDSQQRFSVQLRAPRLMRRPLGSQKPETSCKNVFIAFWLSHGPTDMRPLCSAHGAVGLSAMMPTVLPLIFGRLWKPNSMGRSLTLYLPSQIGHRREGSWALSAKFSIRRWMNKAIPQEESDIDDSSRAGMREEQETCCSASIPDRKERKIWAGFQRPSG